MVLLGKNSNRFFEVHFESDSKERVSNFTPILSRYLCINIGFLK